MKLDQLELLLSGAEILEYHSHPQTIAYVLETKSNVDVAKQHIKLLIRNTVMKPKPAPANEWNTLLKHLIKLVKDVYICVDVAVCHQVQYLM